MLLFIKVVKQDDSHILIFQNISCYCLSFCYSVHNIRTITFQNISCYCLSLDREKESIKREHFKTSHVIVYQSKEMSRHGCITISKHLMLLFICASLLYVLRTLVFQNISCYCLSIASVIVAIFGRKFQNISCYCLSFDTEINICFLNIISKHLMLLFISNLAYRGLFLIHFKTSHVIVYQFE